MYKRHTSLGFTGFSVQNNSLGERNCFKITAHGQENSAAVINLCFPVSSLNDYRPLALTPFWWSALKILFSSTFKNNISLSLDTRQFAYWTNCSTENDVFTDFQSSLILQNNNTYNTILFVDFRSVCNTLSTRKIISKLWAPSQTDPKRFSLAAERSPLNCWTQEPPRAVCSAPTCSHCTSTTAAPKHLENPVAKSADEASFIGHIKNIDDTAYKEEINAPTKRW